MRADQKLFQYLPIGADPWKSVANPACDASGNTAAGLPISFSPAGVGVFYYSRVMPRQFRRII